ncbi:MAG: ABC transporter ATP-binding protein [Pseudomonadota bacterium]
MVKIQIEAASVSIGRRAVLQDVSATFEGGSLIGIIGPNGAGKSTLARAILGLLPVASGHIRIDDRDVATMDRPTLARTIAYLSQGQTLHWPLSVERLVALGRLPYLAPLSRLLPDDAAAIDRAIQLADVGELRQRIATELSGGERARALLARALAVEAPALVVDEPLASLDPGHQLEVMDLLKRQAGSGTLVVAILHDLTLAARYCDRLLLLGQGHLIADGTPADVLTEDRLASVYGITASIDRTSANPVIIPLSRI